MRVLVKPGVTFTKIAPAGFRLLGAIERAARVCDVDLTITSACDGTHSGPKDPHKLGESYDIRSKNLTPQQKVMVLRAIMVDLSEMERDSPLEVANGIATRHFFGFLEAPGKATEHLHIQRRKGTSYP